MRAVLIQLDDDQHARLVTASQAAGVSVRRFCRNAIDAAAQINDSGVLQMVKDIHRAVCGTRGGDAPDEALAALSALGITNGEARRLIAKVQPRPNTTEELVAAALRHKGA